MISIHPQARAAQIEAVRDWSVEYGAPAWGARDMDTHREVFRKASAVKLIAPLPDIARVESMELDLKGGRREARLYEPHGAIDGPLAVYVHGGGYAVGGLVEADAEVRRLAATHSIRILSVSYRLAPEYPWPAGIEDVEEILLAIRAGRFMKRPDRMALIGVSSGAGLAAAVTRRMIDAETGRPDLLVLMSPWLDATLTLPATELYATGYFQEMSQMRDFQRFYARGVATDHVELSPARHPVPTGWPRTVILAAELDPLADDAALFARRLSEADIAHEIRFARGMLHGFHTWWQRIPAITPDLEWLDRHLSDWTVPNG